MPGILRGSAKCAEPLAFDPAASSCGRTSRFASASPAWLRSDRTSTLTIDCLVSPSFSVYRDRNLAFRISLMKRNQPRRTLASESEIIGPRRARKPADCTLHQLRSVSRFGPELSFGEAEVRLHHKSALRRAEDAALVRLPIHPHLLFTVRASPLPLPDGISARPSTLAGQSPRNNWGYVSGLKFSIKTIV